MRTGHIITRTSKGSKLGFDGAYDKAKTLFHASNPDAGETVELWSSSGGTKIKKGAPEKAAKK